MRDTLEEDDVLMISVEYKTYICKYRSREDDFSSKFRCRRAAYNDFAICYKLRKTAHADCDEANKLKQKTKKNMTFYDSRRWSTAWVRVITWFNLLQTNHSYLKIVNASLRG